MLKERIVIILILGGGGKPPTDFIGLTNRVVSRSKLNITKRNSKKYFNICKLPWFSLHKHYPICRPHMYISVKTYLIFYTFICFSLKRISQRWLFTITRNVQLYSFQNEGMILVIFYWLKLRIACINSLRKELKTSLNALILQGFQSEIHVRKMAFWQCFWVSWKASNFAPC